jgi:DNA-binding transcriptional regulator GbsR (MarR family)
MSVRYEELRSYLNEMMAKMFEEDGFSPLVGRIFSLLLFAPEPLSLQHMAEQLGVTKAAVSIQVRSLEKSGMCFKLARGNDRKDYYYIADDFSITVMQTLTQKLVGAMQGIEETIRRFPDVTDAEPGERPSLMAARKRLEEIRALHQIIYRRLDGLEEEWRQWKERYRAD